VQFLFLEGHDRGEIALQYSSPFMVRPVDTTEFYFDIYVGGKVRWRARRSLALLLHARIASRRVASLPARVDSGIKEQHGARQ
jgi:hypothetical protein